MKINSFKKYVTIDLVVLLLVTWVLTSHCIHVGYASVTDCLHDIRLRNTVLIIFYYAVSRLSFHFFKKESYIVTLIVLLTVSLRETYIGIIQLLQGAPYPVGTLLNPNIFACLLSIACSILLVLAFELRNRVLRVMLYISVGTFAVMILLSKSRLAVLSVIVPVMCFFSLNSRSSGFIKKHIMLISIMLTVLFAVMYFLKKPSADGRIYMAKIAVKSIVHNGIWGSGADSYAGVFGNEQFLYYSDYSDNVNLKTLVSLDKGDNVYACTPLTAFNEFLRLGVEYGLIAMLLALYIFLRGMVVLIKNGSSLGFGLLSLFVISQFSYPHCYSVYCLLLSIFVGAAGSMDCHITRPWFKCIPLIGNAVGVLLFGTMLFLELPQIEYRNKLDKMENDIAFFFRNGEFATVCDYCEKQIDKDFLSLNLLYEYGVSLSMTGQYEKSDSILKVGASRSSNPIFWHEIGHNNVRREYYDKAELSYIRSFLMVPNRITPLYYLAQLYNHIGDTEKLSIIASYSDTFKPKIPSYTTKEYKESIRQMANEE